MKFLRNNEKIQILRAFLTKDRELPLTDFFNDIITQLARSDWLANSSKTL